MWFVVSLISFESKNSFLSSFQASDTKSNMNNNINVIYQSQVFLLLCDYATLLCMCYIIMLCTCAWDDGATTWYHQVNNIKGGSSFLFTIGNADFELNTSVIMSASGNPLFS